MESAEILGVRQSGQRDVHVAEVAVRGEKVSFAVPSETLRRAERDGSLARLLKESAESLAETRNKS